MTKIVKEIREEPTVVEDRERGLTAERVVWFIGGVIMALIALRIVLSLLGANEDNAFASLIYGLSYPFVAPFFGLFNYRMQYGVSRFEFESVVALIVWWLVTYGIARLIRISRSR